MPSLFCGLLHDVFQRVSAHPIPIEICYGMLRHASLSFSLSLGVPISFSVSLGVPIATDAVVQTFVAKTCRAITDDVEKFDAIQDGFIHY